MNELQDCPLKALKKNIICKRVNKMGKKQIGMLDIVTETKEDTTTYGLVLDIGEEVTSIKVGDYIIMPLMSSLRTTYDNVEFLTTNEDYVVSKIKESHIDETTFEKVQ
jgi:co-chaperonin GroES (HSP10)